MSHLRNKIALITGGSRGIGAGIARKLAAEGATVIITFKSNETAASNLIKELESKGGKGLALKVDALKIEDIQYAAGHIFKSYGRLDILINNAGYMDTSGTRFEDIPLQTIDETFNVNVRATFLFAQLFSPLLTDGGRIINIGSCLADRVPGPGLTLYSMSKSAITGLTKGLARDLGRRGITVNQISPGPIDTEMNPANGPSADFQRSLTVKGQYGETEDIANAANFLCLESSSFITGANLPVDGGTNI
jgi:3-oxoacyl-[acyl-carrier protein] reductase